MSTTYSATVPAADTGSRFFGPEPVTVKTEVKKPMPTRNFFIYFLVIGALAYLVFYLWKPTWLMDAAGKFDVWKAILYSVLIAVVLTALIYLFTNHK